MVRLLLAGIAWCSLALFAAAEKPNFVVFLTDDQGYNDVGCYGSPQIRTPNFDRMAAEGLRFTNFYAQNACGPSRAALLTGSYPMRCGEPGNEKHPHTILHPREFTLAELLKPQGYATACIGKWHLAGEGGPPGNRPGGGPRGQGPFPPERMPNAQGFDYFFGTPMHNGFTREPSPQFTVILMRNEKVVELSTDVRQLTQRYTQEALDFIREHRDQPFFLYLAHNMPHVPLGASENFRGRSPRGRYGDAIEELDWSCGEILNILKELGLDERTLVIFTSDNGPWLEPNIGDDGGSAAPLRGGKMTTWEGGVRVPTIMRWPKTIAAGRVCAQLASNMDLFPTLAALAGATPPADLKIDGHELWPLFSGDPQTPSPTSHFYYYTYTHLQAVRNERWKLVAPRPKSPPWTSWYGRLTEAVADYELYDLQTDLEERHNVAAAHPEIVAQLKQRLAEARLELGDYDRFGRGTRFFDPPLPEHNGELLEWPRFKP